MLSHHFLFPAYSWNRDEPVYLWQAAALARRLLHHPDRRISDVLPPVAGGGAGHSFFSQYTLGWPLILLAADVVVGTPAGALALGAALTVVGTYLLARELVDDPRVPLLAALVMLVSPIVVIQSGTYLGYLFTLGLGLLFVTALCSGVRHGQARAARRRRAPRRLDLHDPPVRRGDVGRRRGGRPRAGRTDGSRAACRVPRCRSRRGSCRC